MPDENQPDPNEEVTVTRGQLEAMLERRTREANMTPEQKEVRSMIREEVKGAFDELFQIDDEPEDTKRKQAPKGAGSKGSKTLLDQILGN